MLHLSLNSVSSQAVLSPMYFDHFLSSNFLISTSPLLFIYQFLISLPHLSWLWHQIPMTATLFIIFYIITYSYCSTCLDCELPQPPLTQNVWALTSMSATRTECLNWIIAPILEGNHFVGEETCRGIPFVPYPVSQFCENLYFLLMDSMT